MDVKSKQSAQCCLGICIDLEFYNNNVLFLSYQKLQWNIFITVHSKFHIKYGFFGLERLKYKQIKI